MKTRSQPLLSSRRKTKAQVLISTDRGVTAIGQLKIFEALLQKILQFFKRPSVSVELHFARNATIKKLNARYRKKNVFTDILSFSAPSSPKKNGLDMGEPPLLGSLVISAEVARQQAHQYGHGVKREVYELAVHGFLHLLGFDHEKAKQAKIMKKLEVKFNKQLDLLMQKTRA
jgi:probable rRNA maturation factor